MIKNSLGKVGEIGQEITAKATTVGGLSLTSLVSLELPVGVWQVSPALMAGGGGANTSWALRLDVKGVAGSIFGDDQTQAIVNASFGCQVTFPTRTVKIIAGDANKTVVIMGSSSAGNGTAYSVIRAIKIGL